MPYRDFPGWLKLVTVLLTVAIVYAAWRGVRTWMASLDDFWLYVVCALIAAGIGGLWLLDRRTRRREAGRQDRIGRHKDVAE